MFGDLDCPPESKEGMYWADYAELRALVHPDKCFSSGDLAGVAQRAKDIGRGFMADEQWKLVTDLIHMRVADYGDIYPFRVSTDEDTIELAFDESDAQTAYLGLLIASCLRGVNSKERGSITRDFEDTSYIIFEKLMPIGSEIRATWAGAGTGARYTGTLFQKLTALATDLRCLPNFNAADFSPTDTGDGGIDIVSWHPMADALDGMPIAFAQCGCSKDDWDYKQIEAHTAKHRPKLPTRHPWANYYFMPLHFRQSNGDWAKKSDLGEVILVDRLRILKLGHQYGVLSSLPTMAYVAEALVHTHI
jgi:hypothetical protein